MATISREQRRRKIVERGQDRLALITGRLQNLPEPPHHAHTVSSPGFFDNDQDLQSLQPSQGVVPQSEEDATTRTAQLRKCETSVDNVMRKFALENTSNDIQPSRIQSTVPAPSNSPFYTKYFSANQISSSISASENMRVLCSVTIALLVVFSQLRIPLLSNMIKSFVASRPLLLVLLTDITIVLGRVLYGKHRAPKKTGEEAKAVNSDGGADRWVGMGQALETAMLLYKAIGAAFIDCSIYAVIVICGLSLL